MLWTEQTHVKFIKFAWKIWKLVYERKAPTEVMADPAMVLESPMVKSLFEFLRPPDPEIVWYYLVHHTLP